MTCSPVGISPAAKGGLGKRGRGRSRTSGNVPAVKHETPLIERLPSISNFACEIVSIRNTLGHQVAPCCNVKELMRIRMVCSLLVCMGTVYAADAGTPGAALAVTRAYLGKGFAVIDPPTLTPDDKATVSVKQGERACAVTLVRRASVLSGWKISAQNCKAAKTKHTQHG